MLKLSNFTIEMSIEMYGWEPTFELLVSHAKAFMTEMTLPIERVMVPAIFHVCIGFT